MIAAGLTLLAFFALAGAMPRHAPILLGRWAPKIRPGMLRALGWVLLLAALAATLWARDWPIALVRWFGLLPLATGGVLLGLAYDARLARGVAALGVLAIMLGMLR